MKPLVSLFTFVMLTTSVCRIGTVKQEKKFSAQIERLKVEKGKLIAKITEIDQELAKLSSNSVKETSMRITLTSIFVDDPIKAFQFYTEVLGFVEKMYIPEAKLAVVASPEEPDGTGLLLEPADASFVKTYHESLFKAGFPAIVFGVEDIQKEYERLTSLGVVFRSMPEKTEWGTQAIFEDTCGNLIQLHQK